MSDYPLPDSWVLEKLRLGLVIPAHPLALTAARKLDEVRQRALTRYYHAAQAGGLAVAVHTTQFEIRRPEHALLEPVLELASTTVRACDERTGRQTVLIGGICGQTPQAVTEATRLRDLGYHAGLLSVAAFPEEPEAAILDHCRVVAQHLPIFGFYLQPAVGGRVLSRSFWRGLAEIPNLVGIKIAAFNRYQTLDVIRAVAEAGRAEDLALYTGNDDNIVIDLLTDYKIQVGSKSVGVRMVGGLLGHWACWTSKAVALLDQCKQARGRGSIPGELLSLAARVTEANAALFDAAHQFAGCIAGIHEVLRRQGLLENLVCLDPDQRLSPGQKEEIDRICEAFPELGDDDFVRAHLDDWLRS